MEISHPYKLCPSSGSLSSNTIRPCESVFFSPYNSPPYWSSELRFADEIKHLQQMQHIRFPTPPMTPPRMVHKYAEDAIQTDSSPMRTQSVIMKVEQGKQSTQVVRAQIYTIDEHKFSDSSESATTSTSSPSTEFVCSWIECGRYFEGLDALAQHVTQQHAIASSDGLYYCRWSGCLRSDRGFNARYKMLVHVRTHTKEKPHQCHLCEKSFSRAENLKIHIRSHSGEKPYKCTFEGCQKAYSNSSDRFKHTRTHSMEKPYVCKVAGCQKRYTDPSSLRKHVKTFKHDEQQFLSSSQLNILHVSETSMRKHCILEPNDPFLDRVDSQCYLDESTHYWMPTTAATTTTEATYKNSPTITNDEDYNKNFLMDIDLDLNMPLDLSMDRVNRG